MVIDNTSQFRYDNDIPLVIPEVNAHAIAHYKNRGIIANPNCSTIQMLVALKPLHQAVGIERINVATYQPPAALKELPAAVRPAQAGQQREISSFLHSQPTPSATTRGTSAAAGLIAQAMARAQAQQAQRTVPANRESFQAQQIEAAQERATYRRAMRDVQYGTEAEKAAAIDYLRAHKAAQEEKASKSSS